MAAKKKVEVKEVVPTELKYRYQFSSYGEYDKYKGPKG
jgi:hypothetical protein